MRAPSGPLFACRAFWRMVSDSSARSAMCCPGVMTVRSRGSIPRRSFGPTRKSSQVAGLLANLTYFGSDRVGLVGASLGGVLAPFVVSQLASSVRERLKIVIVDAPAGIKTMVDPMARWASLARLVSPVTRHIKVPVTGEMLPRDDQITTSFDRWRLYEIAKRDLSGHKVSTLVGQTAWMDRVERDGSLAEACKALVGLDVVYMVCAEWNATIRQPRAVEWWQAQVPTLRVVEVKATHCGFLQNQPEFVDTFRDIFGT